MTQCLTAKLWSKLPDEFHFKGEPTDWVKMTRPGQSLHSFLEGPDLIAMATFGLLTFPMDVYFVLIKMVNGTLIKNMMESRIRLNKNLTVTL